MLTGVGSMKKTDQYNITYHETGELIEINGSLKLTSMDHYNELVDFLIDHTEKSTNGITLDLTGLEMLNSSGIASLSLFIIRAKESGKNIRILANRDIHWQAISIDDFIDINSNVSVEYITHH
jgi:hypothetical protein